VSSNYLLLSSWYSARLYFFFLNILLFVLDSVSVEHVQQPTRDPSSSLAESPKTLIPSRITAPTLTDRGEQGSFEPVWISFTITTTDAFANRASPFQIRFESIPFWYTILKLQRKNLLWGTHHPDRLLARLVIGLSRLLLIN
jgi:hypothetical protein